MKPEIARQLWIDLAEPVDLHVRQYEGRHIYLMSLPSKSSLEGQTAPLSVGRMARSTMTANRASGPLPKVARNNGALERLSASAASVHPAMISLAISRGVCGEDCEGRG